MRKSRIPSSFRPTSCKISEEQDEETMEWEQEQLRRGGLRVTDAAEKAPKPVYKPAPSTLRFALCLGNALMDICYC